MRFDIVIHKYDDEDKLVSSSYDTLEQEQYKSIVRFLVEDVQLSIPIEKVAKMFSNFADTSPCEYGFEEDDWCKENCSSHEFSDCWLHVIKEGWIR